MKILFLVDVLTHELQDIASAERQLQEVLPSLQNHFATGKVKAIIKQYHQQLTKHVRLLERSATELRISLDGPECQGMAGLLKEGQHALTDEVSPTTDLLLIGALRRMCHYKVVAYDTGVLYAQALRKGKLAKWLVSCQREEEKLDKKLLRVLASTVLPKVIGRKLRR